MRCQRCGFEIEPGQTFCSMCGTEQAKALRPKKRKINSIFWVIKVASKNHLRAWINFFMMFAVLMYIVFGCEGQVNQWPYLCLGVMLMGYIIFQCLIPYKNPNASKTKKYKVGMRVSFILIFILLFLVLVTDTFSLMEIAKKIGKLL